MKNAIIPIGSFTAAKRASRYLAGKGITAPVERISGSPFGCGFGIRTSEPAAYICGLLDDIGIRCGGSMPVPPPPPPMPPRPPRTPRPPKPPRPPKRGR